MAKDRDARGKFPDGDQPLTLMELAAPYDQSTAAWSGLIRESIGRMALNPAGAVNGARSVRTYHHCGGQASSWLHQLRLKAPFAAPSSSLDQMLEPDECRRMTIGWDGVWGGRQLPGPVFVGLVPPLHTSQLTLRM